MPTLQFRKQITSRLTVIAQDDIEPGRLVTASGFLATPSTARPAGVAEEAVLAGEEATLMKGFVHAVAVGTLAHPAPAPIIVDDATGGGKFNTTDDPSGSIGTAVSLAVGPRYLVWLR